MKYSEYSQDWRDVIRPSILLRDGYCCKQCGIRNKSRVYKSTSGTYIVLDSFADIWAQTQGKKVFTLYLQVAHLDHDKGNNNPINLLTLCPSHHSKHDADHKSLLLKTYRATSLDLANKPSNYLITEDRKEEIFIKNLIKDVCDFKITLQECRLLAEQIKKYYKSII